MTLNDKKAQSQSIEMLVFELFIKYLTFDTNELRKQGVDVSVEQNIELSQYEYIFKYYVTFKNSDRIEMWVSEFELNWGIDLDGLDKEFGAIADFVNGGWRSGYGGGSV